jgi:hypothetical protein
VAAATAGAARGVKEENGEHGWLPARVWEGVGAGFYICWAGWARWAAGPRAGTWAASCLQFSCRAGPALWADIAAQPSPTSCSCRPRPDNIVLGSCSCRAKKSCFGPTHGPRAFWPSIFPVNGSRINLSMLFRVANFERYFTEVVIFQCYHTNFLHVKGLYEERERD